MLNLMDEVREGDGACWGHRNLKVLIGKGFQIQPKVHWRLDISNIKTGIRIKESLRAWWLCAVRQLTLALLKWFNVLKENLEYSWYMSLFSEVSDDPRKTMITLTLPISQANSKWSHLKYLDAFASNLPSPPDSCGLRRTPVEFCELHYNYLTGSQLLH